MPWMFEDPNEDWLNGDVRYTIHIDTAFPTKPNDPLPDQAQDPPAKEE